MSTAPGSTVSCGLEGSACHPQRPAVPLRSGAQASGTLGRKLGPRAWTASHSRCRAWGHQAFFFLGLRFRLCMLRVGCQPTQLMT